MAYAIEQREGVYALMSGEAPAKTPFGAPICSKHRDLMEEVATDVTRYGLDPTTRTTLYSLHASYLDFGRMVPRTELEANVLQIWPEDVFVNRPADPSLMMPLMGLWGSPGIDEAGFRKALSELRLRQLMSVMMAGQMLHTAVLGWKVVTAHPEFAPDLQPLAMGACDRFMSWVATTGAPGSIMIGESGRYEPYETDPSFCKKHCCSRRAKKSPAFTKTCEVSQLLDLIRRFAAFPEE